MTDFQAHYGPWALVTGACGGMGEEFARQLAARGLNLVLVARRKNRLDRLATELEARHGIQAHTVAADLAAPDGVSRLAQSTRGLEIGLVIPNAGVEQHGAFLKGDLLRDERLVRLNVQVPMQLARLYGQPMVHRGRGGILLVSSAFGYQAVPYFANDAASKAYVLIFGESLHHELKRHGVDVTVLAPGLAGIGMAAHMADVNFGRLPLRYMEVAPVVSAGLDALGQRPSLVPGAMNNLMSVMSTRMMSRRNAGSLYGGMLEKAMAPEAV